MEIYTNRGNGLYVKSVGRNTTLTNLMCGDIIILGDNMLCLMCNKEFEKKHFNQKYCSDECKYKAKRISQEKYKKTEKGLKIKNDKMNNDNFKVFLVKAFKNAYKVLKDGASFYCWYASKEVVNFHSSLEESGFTVKQELIWNKNSLVMGRQDYQWKHEPCLYGWKDNDSHSWYGDRKQTTVINWDRPTKADLHPTMKPIGLFDYQIRNSSKSGDNILDLFGGSGTTIMACEQNNRNAFLMEFDPRYVDVIIERWEKFTGKKAVKIEGE